MVIANMNIGDTQLITSPQGLVLSLDKHNFVCSQELPYGYSRLPTPETEQKPQLSNVLGYAQVLTPFKQNFNFSWELLLTNDNFNILQAIYAEQLKTAANFGIAFCTLSDLRLPLLEPEPTVHGSVQDIGTSLAAHKYFYAQFTILLARPLLLFAWNNGDVQCSLQGIEI